MNLKEYQTNLKVMEKMLEMIKEEGIFVDNLGGVVNLSVTIHREWTMDHSRRISSGVGDFIRLATIRKIDLTALELLRLADKCGVDVIDDLLMALPQPRLYYVTDMMKSKETFLEGVLK